jgi:hypothetical protein
MKKVICAILLLATILSLVGCSPTINEGEVYEKEYRAEFTTVMMLPLTISNGKTVTTTIIPYVVHYPDRYVIHIKAFVNDEWMTEDFYVSKEVYDSINIGDMFVYDDKRGDLQDEPYTKERQESEDKE